MKKFKRMKISLILACIAAFLCAAIVGVTLLLPNITADDTKLATTDNTENGEKFPTQAARAQQALEQGKIVYVWSSEGGIKLDKSDLGALERNTFSVAAKARSMQNGGNIATPAANAAPSPKERVTMRQATPAENEETYSYEQDSHTMWDALSAESAENGTKVHITLLDPLEGGEYVVPEGADMVLDMGALWNMGGEIVVNGSNFTLTGADEPSGPQPRTIYNSRLFVRNGARTEMTGGTISGITATSGDGGGVVVVNDSTFTLRAGNITGNSADNCGGVMVQNNCKFYMHGGNIENNTASRSRGGGAAGGIGIAVNSEFVIYGGRISNNYAVEDGGGIQILRGSTARIEGGEIVNNSCGNIGKTIHVGSGGTLSISNGTISGTAGGEFIYVSPNGKMTMSGGQIYGQKLTGVNLENATFEMSGGSIHDTICAIFVRENSKVILRGNAQIYNNNAGNGYGGGINMRAGTTVEISGNVKIYNNRANYGGGIINTKGTLRISGGEIYGNQANGNVGEGGAIYNEGGNTYITGGSFYNNSAQNSGGGIKSCNFNGTGVLQLSNCSINNNSSYQGGGVYFSSGTVSFNNVTIQGNQARGGKGGGIYTLIPVTLTNGTIKDNTANDTGGGIYTTNSLTMSGGLLTNNKTTTNQAGGVSVGSGTFTMTGGTIEKSVGKGVGGGVFVGSGATFNFRGGNLLNNRVEPQASTGWCHGGAMYVQRNAFCNLSGGTIQGNTSSDCGGAIFLNGGSTCTISGSVNITGNTGGRGAIFTNGGDSTCTMSGGTIQGNNGGSTGVLVNRSTFKMTGGKIINNRGGDTGGIHNSGSLAISGGEISGNTATAASAIRSTTAYTVSGGTINGDCLGTVTVSDGTIRGAVNGGVTTINNKAKIYNTDGKQTYTVNGNLVSGAHIEGPWELDFFVTKDYSKYVKDLPRVFFTTNLVPAGEKRMVTLLNNEAYVAYPAEYPTLSPDSCVYSPTVTNYTDILTIADVIVSVPGGFAEKDKVITIYPDQFAGTYEIGITPDRPYCWEKSGALEQIKLTYTIEKALFNPQIVNSDTMIYGEKLLLECEGNLGFGAESWAVANGTGKADLIGSMLTATQAGTVTVTLNIGDTVNYKASSPVTMVITIEKATYDLSRIEWTQPRRFTYDKKPHGVTVVPETLPEKVSILTYKGNYSETDASPSYIAEIDEVAYDTVNYNKPVFPDSVRTCEWRIDKALRILEIDYGEVFCGTRAKPVISSITDLYPDDQAEWSYFETDGRIEDFDVATGEFDPIGSGVVFVTLDVKESNNYFGNSLTVEVKIEKGKVSATLDYGTVVFGKFAYPTFSCVSDGAVEYMILGADDASKATIDENGVILPLRSGEITVTVIVGETQSYYSLQLDVKVTIEKVDLATSDAFKLDITTPAEDMIFKNAPWEPEFSTVFDMEYEGVTGFVLENDCFVTYERNVDAGTAKLVLTAKPDSLNFKNSVECEFIIRKADLANAIIEILTDPDKIVFDGAAWDGFRLGFSVDYAKTLGLIEDDYELIFDENINAGKHVLTIRAKSSSTNFTGEQSIGFEILKAIVDISNMSWDYSEAFIYDGDAHKVGAIGIPEGMGLVIKYFEMNPEGQAETDSPVNAGKYIARLETPFEEGNYEFVGGVRECPYEIKKRDITSADIHWNIQEGDRYILADNSTPEAWFEFNGVKYNLQVRITEGDKEFGDLRQLGDYVVKVLGGDYMQNFNYVGEDVIEVTVKIDPILIAAIVVVVVVLILLALNLIIRYHIKKTHEAQAAQAAEKVAAENVVLSVADTADTAEAQNAQVQTNNEQEVKNENE